MRPGQERPAIPGKVFCIYVNDERIIYLWCWEQADSRDQRLPENFDTRFEERLLP